MADKEVDIKLADGWHRWSKLLLPMIPGKPLVRLGACSLLMFLIDRHNRLSVERKRRKGWLYYTVNDLEEELGIPKDTQQTLLTALVESGFIKWNREPSNGTYRTKRIIQVRKNVIKDVERQLLEGVLPEDVKADGVNGYRYCTTSGQLVRDGEQPVSMDWDNDWDDDDDVPFDEEYE